MSGKKTGMLDRITKITLVVGLIGLIANVIFGIYLKSFNASLDRYVIAYYLGGISGFIFVVSAAVRNFEKMSNH
jgi:hypothetical protein